MLSYGNRRTKPKSKRTDRTRLDREIGGRLPHTNLPGGSCIHALQKQEKHRNKKRTATRPLSERFPLKIRQEGRRSVSLIATRPPSKVHETFERRSVFHPQ